MSVNLPAPSKHSNPSSRYMKRQNKKERPMAYLIGTKFFISSLELLDRGSVNIFRDEFEILVSDLIHMRFRFAHDRKRGNASFAFTGNESDKTLSFELYNYSTPYPEGCFEPAKIVTLEDGRALYISFTVQTISERHSARVFTYNLYMDRKYDG
jgi:hypothetical protein